MSEFNLSDKLQKFEGWHSEENRFIHISHVKEFVKKLKEEICYRDDARADVDCEIIERLTGRSLIEK